MNVVHKRYLQPITVRHWLSMVLLLVTCRGTLAETRIGDICHVKGQEPNTLNGLGLVVGLNGTGDGTLRPTARSLVQIMEKMVGGAPSLEDVKDAKNVALVTVTAEIPAHGGRQGDSISCTVSALDAKSLEGGFLLMTPMLAEPLGWSVENAQVWAYAQGNLRLEDPATPTKAKITHGCQLARRCKNEFVLDNKITLVLHGNLAGFGAAESIESAINDSPELAFELGEGQDSLEIANAIDAGNVEVQVRPGEDPVRFVSNVLMVKLLDVPANSVVGINERTGVVVISADLEIAPAVVNHKNMTVRVGDGAPASQFVGLDPTADTSKPNLEALVQALNALNVSATDVIDIIRELDNNGHIYGRVEFRK